MLDSKYSGDMILCQSLRLEVSQLDDHHYCAYAQFLLQISVNVLDGFLQQIESGYNLYSNPYHNAIHASDVTQSMHSLLWETGLKVLNIDYDQLIIN